MVDSHPGVFLSWRGCKAVSTLLPYAIFLEQCGQPQVLDAISHMAKAMQPKILTFMWYPVRPFITTLFKKPNPPSLNWVLGLISPNVPWHDGPHDRNMVSRQAATTSAALDPEEVHWSVADELLHIAFFDSLQPIPSDFSERPEGTGGDITHKVQALGDFGILKSYLLLVWPEWCHIGGLPGDLTEMQASIREEFCGIEMFWHREDLIKQLNDILFSLENHQLGQTEEPWRELKRVLLELDEEAVNALVTRKPPTFLNFDLLTPVDVDRTSLDFHMCSPSPIPMILHSENLGLPPPTNHFSCTSILFPHSPCHLHFPGGQWMSKGIFWPL